MESYINYCTWTLLLIGIAVIGIGVWCFTLRERQWAYGIIALLLGAFITAGAAYIIHVQP